MGKRKRACGHLSAMQQKGGLAARESDLRKQRLQAELRVKRFDNDLKKLEQNLLKYCANPSTKPKDTRRKRDVLRGAARPWTELQKEPDHLHVDPTENLWEKYMGQFCRHDVNSMCILRFHDMEIFTPPFVFCCRPLVDVKICVPPYRRCRVLHVP